MLLSGSGSNLQALIDASRQPASPWQITAVISDNPTAYGLTRAHAADVPAIVVAKQPNQSRDDYDRALAREVQEIDPDLVVLAGFMRIIAGPMIDTFAGRILNIHPALLPKYKGLNTYERCLAAGDPMHGTTVHFVTLALDDGPPVIQGEVAVRENDNIDSLKARVQALEHQIYPMAVRWFAEDRLIMREGQAWLDSMPLVEPVTVDAGSLST